MVPDHTYLTRSMHSNLSQSHQQIYIDPLPREEGLPTQSTARWLSDPRSVPSFSPTTVNEVVEKRQASVDNQLLGLPGPYYRMRSVRSILARGSQSIGP
jgi:hypothetical protein